jgi:HAD superfamily hydrolase (TIGR01509 family)
MSNEPAAYLVDFDGTLYHSLPVKLAMALEVACFGLTAAKLLSSFRHAHEQLRVAASDASRSPFDRQIEFTANQLGDTTQHVRAVVDEWMFARPRKWIRRARRQTLLAELQSARARGAKVAVVSDYPASFKLSALDGWLAVDTVVSNGEQGGPFNLKPDPEGYLIAANRLGVTPKDCLVIGDRDDADGEAARRAGMQFRLVV